MRRVARLFRVCSKDDSIYLSVMYVQAVVDAITFLNSVCGHRVMVIGCAYDPHLVDVTVRDSFQEKLCIFVPSPRRRKNIAKVVLQGHALEKLKG